MITLMINRFTGAMAELDRTADTLRIRTAEIEAQLRRADLKLRQQREMTILAQERARLMRDLHDGLGGDMVAVLALAERGDGAGQEIAFHARAALADMRLIIASLEDYGGDLAMALGAWKERAEPQIVAAGMILHWQIEELGETLQFGPAQVLDILRILQEALTNVIHHARAASITVGAALAADSLSLTFADDGGGLGASARVGARVGARAGSSRVGRGLANMRSRASALGGGLEITATGAGTSIVLHVPLMQAR
jgi:signal transduction histidine kinase